MALPRLSFFAFSLLLSLILISSPLALSKTLKRDGTVSSLKPTTLSLRSDLRSKSHSLSVFFFFGLFLAAVKALNEIKASLGWRVVYAWVGDDPCGDGDLPPWSGVTCSTQGDYRVVTELYIDSFFVSFWNFHNLMNFFLFEFF